MLASVPKNWLKAGWEQTAIEPLVTDLQSLWWTSCWDVSTKRELKCANSLDSFMTAIISKCQKGSTASLQTLKRSANLCARYF